MRRALLLALALCACRDAGAERLTGLKARYAALAQVGTPAQSRDFDGLLQELRAIPVSSRAHGEAQALIHSIEAARAGPIGRPLAVAATPLPDLHSPALQPQLEQNRAECERLAKELGGLDAGVRKGKLELLDACRRRSDQLIDAIQHEADEGGDGGAHP